MVHPIVVSPRPFMFTKEKPVMNMYDYCLPWGIVFSSAPASVRKLPPCEKEVDFSIYRYSDPETSI